MFLELLLVIFIQLTVMFGKVGAMLIVMAAAAASVVFVHLFVNWLVCSVMGFGPNITPANRKSKELLKNNQYAELTLEEIAKIVEKNPRDMAASNQLLERYKKQNNHQEIVELLEKILSADLEIDLEHRCMKTHQLADLYTGPLNKTERGLEVLRQFTQEHQATPQAKLMQQKIIRIAQRLENQQNSANMK